MLVVALGSSSSPILSLADNSKTTTGKQVTLLLMIDSEQQQVSFAITSQLNYPIVLVM